jgi:UDP-N-acetylglucosamine 1-carboxyvinyltransferase
MRASVCTLGPLLAKRGEAHIPMPGGCVIGDRPVDLHLKGLRALGADVEVSHGDIVARADRLTGTDIYLGGPSGSTVLGTANVMMAAALAEGTTVIGYAACEPEVQELARFLNACGADIEGIGTHTLTIHGVDSLHGTEHTIIPDRVEAGTYAVAGAITGGELTLTHVVPRHMQATTDVLRRAGCTVITEKESMTVRAEGRPEPANFTALPYPGVPTDMQPQLMALLAVADGRSVITDRVHPQRFTHVAELNRLGADISSESNRAFISGVEGLTGAPVTAPDLRAGAGLILAGLAASSTTEVRDMEQVDRGYEDIEEKLSGISARVRRVERADGQARHASDDEGSERAAAGA